MARVWQLITGEVVVKPVPGATSPTAERSRSPTGARRGLTGGDTRVRLLRALCMAGSLSACASRVTQCQ